MRTSLELRDIVVELGVQPAGQRGRHPFDGFSAHVADGEMVAVTGPPGFGGTTLARVVAGVAAPDSGRVLVNQEDVTDIPAGRRPVAFVPVGGGLLPQLTAKENVTYGLRVRGESGVIVQNSLAAVTERLELLPSLALPPHELSAGQRLRTALARAAMRRFHVLVVDATAGAEGVAQLRNLIERTWPGTARSVLVCTHDPEIARQADRVVTVETGRTVETG